MRRLRSGMLCLAICLPPSAWPSAKPPPAEGVRKVLTERYLACMAANPAATSRECALQELKRQKTRLNAAYKAAGLKLGSERAAQLEAAQKLWVQFRDADCAVLLDPEGGSMAGQEALDCQLEMTAVRAAQLEGLAR
jgi:uncharacterized protein YecT (DUF1311 family)